MNTNCVTFSESIVESDSYDLAIRFNASIIISGLIRKFALSWPISIFQNLDTKDNYLNSDMNDLSKNKMLAKQIGSTYGCLIYGYFHEDKKEFVNFWPKIEPIINYSKSFQIAGFNFLIGLFEFFWKHLNHFDNDNDNDALPNVACKCIVLLQQIEKNPKLRVLNLIESIFELLDSILLIFRGYYEDVKNFSISCYQEKLLEIYQSPGLCRSFYTFVFSNCFNSKLYKQRYIDCCL